MADINKHTPTPWHRNIKPASKYPIIFSGRNKHVVQLICSNLSPEEIEANCDFLLKAINNHEELVKYTKHLIDISDALMRNNEDKNIIKEAQALLTKLEEK